LKGDFSVNQKNDHQQEIPGAFVSSLDNFWLDTARGAVKESIGSLEEAAKQLITAVTLLQGIYFAAISFSDVKKAMDVEGVFGWLKILLFVSPIILWLICLVLAVKVFKPETYKTNLSSPDLAKETLMMIVQYKKAKLDQAYLMLLIGFVPLIGAILYYLKYLPKPLS
jgi:hypothetical protein